MSETLFPAIDKQFLTAKQIEEMTGLKAKSLTKIVERNPELKENHYSDLKKINGKQVRIYFEPIITWLKNYNQNSVKKAVTTMSHDNVSGENKVILSASLIKELKTIFLSEEIRLILINEMKLNYLNKEPLQQNVSNETDTIPKPIDKPKVKDKPLTRRQALHSLIIHYADAKGISYNRMYTALYTEYFGYSGYYELSRQYKNLMDYIKDNNQLDNFAEFVRSKLSE